MRKKDDKVGNKTYGNTKNEGGQREKREREGEIVDRSKYSSLNFIRLLRVVITPSISNRRKRLEAIV